MNQQAFYRDTAIGEFQLDANGMLVYRSWKKARRTIQAIQHFHAKGRHVRDR